MAAVGGHAGHRGDHRDSKPVEKSRPAAPCRDRPAHSVRVRRRRLGHSQSAAFERWGLTTASCLYIGLLAAYMILLRNAPDGLWWMGAALTVTWVFDTGAYLIGRKWGRHPLWPAVSPGKTWEGTIGGAVLGVGLSLAAVRLLGLSYAQAIGLGVLIAVLAQLGDLVESAIKRQVGVKDAGGFLPGHGGILDRIDGLLFSTVGVYYFALLAGK